MGRPQFGLPRLPIVGETTSIAIGPDHTPPWVTPRENLRTGGGWFAEPGGTMLFGDEAVSVEMHHTLQAIERNAQFHNPFHNPLRLPCTAFHG